MEDRGGSIRILLQCRSRRMTRKKMSEINNQMHNNQLALDFSSVPFPASPESCSSMASWSTLSPGKLLVEQWRSKEVMRSVSGRC